MLEENEQYLFFDGDSTLTSLLGDISEVEGLLLFRNVYFKCLYLQLDKGLSFP